MEKFFKHPWAIVAVITVITVVFVFQFPRAESDNNNYGFVPKDNEARVISNYIDNTFSGSSVSILVGLERPFGTAFDGTFLMRIRDYVNYLEELELVGDVSSIMTIDYITADEDSIVVTKQKTARLVI
jgi:predicted RND superfamily exporter protein